MRLLAGLIERANLAMEWLCKVIVFISMTLIFAVLTLNVFARYLRIEMLQVGSEIPEVLFPWLVSASVGLAAIHGAHISIHLLADRLSRLAMRYVGTINAVVIIALYALGLFIVLDLFPIVKDDRSPILGISLGWTYIAMGISFVAILVNQLAAILCLWGLSKRGPLEQIDSSQAAG